MTTLPPIFTGKLLRLAAPQPDDYAIIVKWSNDDEYMRMLDDDPVRPQTLESTTQWFSSTGSHDSYSFRLRTLADDRLIGFIALFSIKWASGSSIMAIGIGEPDYRGKGYGSDALRLLLNYSFNELNLYRVGLSVLSYNAAAIRAYERAGFVPEGRQRGAILRNGTRYDFLQYGILRDEWLSRTDF